MFQLFASFCKYSLTRLPLFSCLGVIPRHHSLFGEGIRFILCNDQAHLNTSVSHAHNKEGLPLSPFHIVSAISYLDSYFHVCILLHRSKTNPKHHLRHGEFVPSLEVVLISSWFLPRALYRYEIGFQ